jgi:hypothetical protein
MDGRFVHPFFVFTQYISGITANVSGKKQKENTAIVTAFPVSAVVTLKT